MLSLSVNNDAYMLVKGNITVTEMVATYADIATDRNNKQAIFKNCTPFTDCIIEVNNTQIELAKDLAVAMPMYNLIEYGDNYSKKTWKFISILQRYAK